MEKTCEELIMMHGKYLAKGIARAWIYWKMLLYPLEKVNR